MRRIILITLIFLFSLISAAGPASGDSLRENPTFYSAAKIVAGLPKMWLANPIEVSEMLKSYPDLTCWKGNGIIGCQSVNNQNCAEIYMSLEFTSDDDYAEFEHLTFSMQIDSTEDVQRVMESFWIEDQKPANIWGADYPGGQVTLYFSTENTLIKYSIPMGASSVWLLRVDFGLTRG